MLHAVYLHGFASSPDSGKARYLRARLSGAGIPLHVPDLNAPDFGTLTVTRMLDQLDSVLQALPGGPVAFIGSSLGGFVALHATARRLARAPDAHPVTRLVLLAPALDFASGRDGWLTAEETDEWRRTGWRDVVHHASGRIVPLHYALWEDAGRYDALGIAVGIPTLIFHGRRDPVVRPSTVEAYAEGKAHVTLRMLDDDHQLAGHLDQVWVETAAFLGLAP